MTDTKTKKESPVNNEKIIYNDEKAKFVITSFDYTIQDGDKQGEVLNLVKFVKTKRSYNKELRAFVEKDNYFNMTAEAFQTFMDAIKAS